MFKLPNARLTTLVLGLIAVKAPGVAVAAPAGAPSASTLLQAMARADQSVAYTATETITRPGGPTMTMRLWRLGSKKRYEYLAPPVMKGDLLVDNGSRVWRYHRAEGSAVQTTTAPRRWLTQGDRQQLSKRFTVAVVGRDTVGGRAAWIVAITPRNSKQVTRKFWIDAATNIRLRSERFSPSGARAETSVLQNITFSRPAAALFEWKPPAGVRQSFAGTLFLQLDRAQREANWLRPPGNLPRGYALESVIVDPKGEAWFRYTNGGNRFSIFQQRSGDGKERSLQQVDGGWYWQRGGNRFLIVGLDAAAVKTVAASVR